MLKRLGMGFNRTNLVALGIGNDLSPIELQYIASEPHDKKIITVKDFSKLPEVEEEVTNASCRGKWPHCIKSHQYRYTTYTVSATIRCNDTLVTLSLQRSARLMTSHSV